ncbi:hypothetical protein Q1695_015517 [Nippostrongylus brasiliensis]|nr:hypothetical protein Q1695_015517 [Nippostrongylus brasiliensis]
MFRTAVGIGAEIREIKFLNTFRGTPAKIAIIEIIDESSSWNPYTHAMMTVVCYARAQNYDFHVLVDTKFFNVCRQKKKTFLQHCIVAYVLKSYDYVLLIDSNMGVVNPTRRIDEYIDDGVDVTFYETFRDGEIMADSYLVKNSSRAIGFLNELADYEFVLPDAFHDESSAAVHAYLADKFPPSDKANMTLCRRIFLQRLLKENVRARDITLYQVCVRRAMFVHDFYSTGPVKILPRGLGWSRDSWLTNSKWSERRDFMLNYWNETNRRIYTKTPVLLGASESDTWFNPLAGQIDITRCKDGNLSWNYDPHLVEDQVQIDRRLQRLAVEAEKKRIALLKFMDTVFR